MEPRKCGKGNPARAYCSVAGRECRHTLDKSRAARSMTRSGRALAKICSCKTVLCYYLSAVSLQRRELISAPFLSHFSKNNGNIPREVRRREFRTRSFLMACAGSNVLEIRGRSFGLPGRVCFSEAANHHRAKP